MKIKIKREKEGKKNNQNDSLVISTNFAKSQILSDPEESAASRRNAGDNSSN